MLIKLETFVLIATLPRIEYDISYIQMTKLLIESIKHKVIVHFFLL